MKLNKEQKTLYKHFLNNLTIEEIFLCRKYRDWELYDSTPQDSPIRILTFLKEVQNTFNIDLTEIYNKLSQGSKMAYKPIITKTGKLKFGKYKKRDINDIIEEDPDYIIWCKDNIDGFTEIVGKFLE